MSKPGGSIAGLQYLRALAAIMVVIFHASVQISQNGLVPPRFSFEGFGDKGVELFFVLSGFIIFFVHWDDPKGGASARKYFWKRVTRILPLTFLVATVWICLLFAANLVGYSTEATEGASWRRWLSSALVLPMLDDPSPGVIWTLKHEAVFYLIFAALFINRWLAVVGTAAWAVLAMTVEYEGMDRSLILLTSNYNVLFSFGMCAFFLYRVANVKSGGALAAFVLTVLFLTYIVFERGYDSHHGLKVLIIGLLSSLMMFSWLSVNFDNVIGKLLAFLGDASFSIYLWHFPILAVVFQITKRLGVTSDVLMCLNSFIAVVTSCVLYVLVERPITTLARGMRRSGAG